MRWMLAVLVALVVGAYAFVAGTDEPELSQPAVDRPRAAPDDATGTVEAASRDGGQRLDATAARDDRTVVLDRRNAERSMYSVLVVDTDGSPIEGARILDSDPPLRTDRGGRLRLIAEPGEAVIAEADGCVRGVGYATRTSREIKVELRHAFRLRVRVRGGADASALHARVRMPRAAKGGPYYQSKYVALPCCGVDGTQMRGGYESATDEVDANGWPVSTSDFELKFGPDASATIDHAEFAGEATVQLLWFDTVLETRTVPFPSRRGTIEVVFERAKPAHRLRGRVVDDAGRSLVDAELRMAPYGGQRVIDSPRAGMYGFPVWSAGCRSDSTGAFDLPRPPTDDCRIVVTCRSYAARAVTVREVEAAHGAIALAPGRTIRLELLDRDGRPLVGSPSTSGDEVVLPAVQIGNHVFRSPSRVSVPWFEFDGLPAGQVAFDCCGEAFWHDVRTGDARYVAPFRAEELDSSK